jgi:Zn-dependent metalloprotease
MKKYFNSQEEKSEREIAYEIYDKLKRKYSSYNFDDFISVEQQHFAIVFRKKEDNGILKFTIERATNPIKIYRREIDLFISGKDIPVEIKTYPEYEEILIDARKIRKGKSIDK